MSETLKILFGEERVAALVHAVETADSAAQEAEKVADAARSKAKRLRCDYDDLIQDARQLGLEFVPVFEQGEPTGRLLARPIVRSAVIRPA